MPTKASTSQVFAPGKDAETVVASDGTIRTPPVGWELLPPGDAGLTRRVKAAGEHWVVQERKGRKMFSRGVWAPSENIHAARAKLEAERSTYAYAKRQAAAAARRERVQDAYVEDFAGAVVQFLDFHPSHAKIAQRLAEVVTDHATPVGSGTVARTKRIPIERRAEAAVIAWMRHQTTGYDSMQIARIKGQRREVRRQLAARSKQLLQSYRQGQAPAPNCPLKAALDA